MEGLVTVETSLRPYEHEQGDRSRQAGISAPDLLEAMCYAISAQFKEQNVTIITGKSRRVGGQTHTL
jgi:hypothetical protein